LSERNQLGDILYRSIILENREWKKSDESRTRIDKQKRKYSKMDKRAKDKLVRSPRENGGGKEDQKDLHSRTGRDEKKGKTQDRMERGSRKRSSCAGSEKMERVGGR
jgi:hypothetical protein